MNDDPDVPVFCRMPLHEGHPDAIETVNFFTGETEWFESDAALRKRIMETLEAAAKVAEEVARGE